MNSAYKLVIDTKKANIRNTHCVPFPLTQKGQHEAEELFEKMKTEPTVIKLQLFRFDGKLHLLKKHEPEVKA